MHQFLAKTRPLLWFSLYGAAFGAVLISYFSSYPIPEFREKCAAVLSTLFLVFSMGTVGKIILDQFHANLTAKNSPGFSFLLEIIYAAVGFGITSSIVLMLGWLWPGSFKLKLTVLAVLLAVLLLRVVHVRNGKYFSISIPHQAFSPGELIAFIGGVGGMGLSFLSCFSPITYYDSLVYHLALPALYNNLGSIQTIPTNLYSFFPGNAEMLYLFILSCFPSPEYVINLLGWTISIGISFVLAQWAQELGGRRQAIIAFVLWWTMPAVLLLTVGGYVDIILSGFLLLAVRCFFISLENAQNQMWVALSGVFSGLAFSTKYTGAIGFILLLAYMLIATFYKKKYSIRTIVLFCLMFFLPAFPWLLKNAISVGNPVFPFLYDWLGGNVGWTKSSAAGYFSMLTEYGAKSNMIYELFISPWQIAKSSLSFGGGFDVLGDFGWLPFVFGAPVAIFLLPKNPAIRFISMCFIGYFVIWFMTKPVLRFLIGYLPLAVLLTATTTEKLLRNKNKWVGRISGLMIMSCLLSNFFLYFFISDVIQPFSVALGIETRDNFLRRRLSFYPTYDRLNTTLTNQQKVLLIGEQRTYHLAIPFLGSNLFAPSPISDYCNQAKDVEDVGRFLKSEGVTHIVLNEGEIERLGGLKKFGFSLRGSRLLGQFLNSEATFLSDDRRVVLYSLKTAG